MFLVDDEGSGVFGETAQKVRQTGAFCTNTSRTLMTVQTGDVDAHTMLDLYTLKCTYMPLKAAVPPF